MASGSTAQRRYGNPPKRPVKALRDAAAAGRGGDSILAHIGPQEAAVLKAMGGAGTANPTTGLPEFTTADVSPKGPEGGTSTLGGAGSAAEAPGGQSGGGTNNGPGTGDLGGGGSTSTNPGIDSRRTDDQGFGTVSPKTTEGASGTTGGAGSDTQKSDQSIASTSGKGNLNLLPPGTSTTPNLDALAAAGTGLSSGDYVKAAANMGNAYADYKDYSNSFAEDVGNFLASYAGFNEINPTKQSIKNFVSQDQADWGFDPAGLIGSVAATAAGVPVGGGLAADMISQALGRPLEVNLGPDVLKGVSKVAGADQVKASRRYGGNK